MVNATPSAKVAPMATMLCLACPWAMERVAHHRVKLLSAMTALLTQNMVGGSTCTQNWPMLLTM